ncbi:MAG: T9SS type A sorting domain-containing protein [Candidatus Eisenbacteria bacterium]
MLLSPVFDLDSADWAEVSYWRWYADETSHDDDFIVDVSNDGGTSWHSLEVVTDSAYPWVHAVIGDLGAILPLTAQMRLRFIAEDTGSGSLVEAAIDDLEIAAVFADPTGVGEPMAGSAPLRIFPSPLDPQSSILMYLPSAGRAQLRIFDVTGAEVGRPVDGALSAGGHAMTWGTAGLPSGVYLAKLTLDGAPLASQS